ncbi:MAG: hypothetical protein ACK56I_26175, partial [bacterium]
MRPGSASRAAPRRRVGTRRSDWADTNSGEAGFRSRAEQRGRRLIPERSRGAWKSQPLTSRHIRRTSQIGESRTDLASCEQQLAQEDARSQHASFVFRSTINELRWVDDPVET